MEGPTKQAKTLPFDVAVTASRGRKEELSLTGLGSSFANKYPTQHKVGATVFLPKGTLSSASRLDSLRGKSLPTLVWYE